MSFETFISSVEAKKLLKERDELLCLASHCTREWEGEIKKKGDKVTIYGLSRPTVYKLNANGTYEGGAIGAGSIAGKGRDIVHKGIPDAEELKGTKIECPVNQVALFNFMVGDIDEQQSSVKGLLAKARPKVAQDIAAQQDEYVRDVIVAKTACKAFEETVTLTSGTASSGQMNILKLVDKIVQQLRQDNVKDSEELYCECSPEFHRVLKSALIGIDTNNSVTVRGRQITTYNGIKFYLTNAVVTDSKEYVIVRTGDSVAFFDPLTEMIPYSPEKGFGDAIKGMHLYDAYVVDPAGCRYVEIGGYAD